MNILYVSDLDGTLLRSDARTSEYTNRTLNRLVSEGVLFSYATARSFETARRVTAGLDARIPVIVYNGAMIVDSADGSFLCKNMLGDDAPVLLDDLMRHGVYPIVYALLDGREVFSYLPDRCTRGMNAFLARRTGDRRARPVATPDALYEGEIFYLTCIDEARTLRGLYETYRARFRCVYSRDLYTQEPWLELMPRAASKANAARWLQHRLGCGRLVAFGDAENDLDLFAAADEAYAVRNAVAPLKAAATAVLGANDDDSVARWLEQHAQRAGQDG